MNKNVCILIIMLVVSSTLNLKSSVSTESVTRRVSSEYATIQEALDAANPGDIVRVSAGTYNENLIVDKAVSLIGESSETTIIDGGAGGTVVDVYASDVYISGFTIRNSGIGTFYSGIHISSYYENILIAGNVILNNEFGVFCEDTRNNTVSGNTIISKAEGDGVYLGNTVFSNISGNVILNSAFGLRLERSSINNIIHRNAIANNSVGVYLTGNSDNNLVYDNILENNTDGLNLASSSNVIRENTLRDNSYGIWSTSLLDESNILYRNNFINNKIQESLLNSSIIEAWDNGAEGNYWSDYNGQDLNGDGIGETEIPHRGFDRYPLIEPWSSFRTFNVALDSQSYVVTTLSSSTIASFSFNQSLSEIRFNVTGPPNTLGSCEITIPKALLEPEPPKEWTITLDHVHLLFTLIENSTHTSLYFTYVHSTRLAQIKVMQPEGSYPIADFTFSPTNPRVYQTVNFTDLSTDSDGIIVSWKWELGDGNISTEQNPQHHYAWSKQYIVTLTVEDNSGAKTAAIEALSVRKVGTTISIEAPSTAIRGDRLNFTGVLKDEDQNLISDAVIGFYLLSQGVWMSIGSNKTGLGGAASFSFLASVEAGTHQFKVVFNGTQILDASSESISVEIQEGAGIFGGLLFWLTIIGLVAVLVAILVSIVIRRKRKASVPDENPPSRLTR